MARPRALTEALETELFLRVRNRELTYKQASKDYGVSMPTVANIIKRQSKKQAEEIKEQESN